MADSYLAQAIQNIAAKQMMEKAKADDEARDIRMAQKMADLQFEHQKRINQLAIEETKKAKQEELGRETAFNASMGFNIQKHAHLLSTDPKERERLKGVGQIMQATGMSPDAVLSYMKIAKGKVGDEFAAEKLELQRERLNLQQTMFDWKKQLQGEKAPPEVMEAQKTYHRAVSDMNKAIMKGEMEPEEITAEYMEAINSSAATVESWRESAGLAPLGLSTIEAEEVPASFISRLFGKKTKTELKLKGKKTTSPITKAEGKPKETPKPTAKKDIKARAIEVKNEHPDWSVEQIQKQLDTEGYKRKAK